LYPTSLSIAQRAFALRHGLAEDRIRDGVGVRDVDAVEQYLLLAILLDDPQLVFCRECSRVLPPTSQPPRNNQQVRRGHEGKQHDLEIG
jgi:hypothetical protein